VQNFLELEQKLALLTANLATSKQSISQLANELKEQAELSAQEIKDKVFAIKELEKKNATDKDIIFNLQKEIRTANLYYQQELRKVRESYQAKRNPLTQQIKELKAILSLTNSEKDEKLVAQQTELVNIKQELNQTINSLTATQQELTNTTTQNTNLSQQITILTTQKDQAQLPFEEIENIIKVNKILLFPIKKKLKERVKEIKTAFH
jgi:chromosome segregation ATPase